MIDGKNLSGKIAVITGASSGIGKATAIQLANCGSIVVLLARTESKLKKLQENIELNGGQAMIIKVDVSVEHEVMFE